MSGDDDDGSVIIIQKKLRRVKEVLSAPVPTVQRWHLVAIALVAFCVGLAF